MQAAPPASKTPILSSAAPPPSAHPTDSAQGHDAPVPGEPSQQQQQQQQLPSQPQNAAWPAPAAAAAEPGSAAIKAEQQGYSTLGV